MKEILYCLLIFVKSQIHSITQIADTIRNTINQHLSVISKLSRGLRLVETDQGYDSASIMQPSIYFLKDDKKNHTTTAIKSV